MVNFIKAASMNDLDFILWLVKHPEFLPKEPSSDYDPRKAIFTICCGYSYAFAPKSKPKEEENVVIPEGESIPQPEKEPENKNENNVEGIPTENNSPNNPVILQTAVPFGVIEDEERNRNDGNGDDNTNVHL